MDLPADAFAGGVKVILFMPNEGALLVVKEDWSGTVLCSDA